MNVNKGDAYPRRRLLNRRQFVATSGFAALAGVAGLEIARRSPAVPHAADLTPVSDDGANRFCPGSGWTLVFHDNFGGNTVDTTKWMYRTDLRDLSSQKASNVSVSKGKLVITLKAESDRGKRFTGGGLITRQQFGYGYYETRVRTTSSPGWHSAFWNKYSADGTSAFDPAAKTEIDCFEVDSVNPGEMRNNIYKWNGASYTTQATTGVYEAGFDTSADFHTYGFEWAEDYVKYYVDGVLRSTLSYRPSDYTHDYPNVWLSVVASAFNGVNPDPAQLPATVEFDYFRYYMRDSYTDNDGPTAERYGETGVWQTSTLSGHTVGNSTRSSTDPGATATWGGWLPADGTYDAYIYNVASSVNDTNSRIDVTHDGGTSTQYVDFATADAGWVRLGTWSFSAGASGSIRLTRGNGTARADAVKLVRVMGSTTNGTGGKPEAVVVDVSDPSLACASGVAPYLETGTWAESTLPGWNGGSTRYSNRVGSSATWTPELGGAAEYLVEAWFPTNPTTTTAANYTIQHADGQSTVVVNQRALGGEWVTLGTHRFDAGTDGSVRLAVNNSAYHRADAVRFTPTGWS